MCVGLPGQVIEIVDAEHGLVKVDIVGQTTTVNTAILQGVGTTGAVGDWLEIHMGHALAVLSEEDAMKALTFFDELDEAHHQDRLDEVLRPPDEDDA